MFTVPQPYVMPPVKRFDSAEVQYETLVNCIRDFERKLNPDEESAVYLAAFGQSVLMSVTQIGYKEPYIITFKGFVNGESAQLIQHVNQLSFLLTKVKKETPPEVPPRRIGFQVD